MYLSYVPDELIHDEHLKYIDYENIKKNMYAITTYGRVMNVKTGKEAKQNDKQGYRTVKLRCTNGKTRIIYVHRLVANAFIPKEYDENGVEKKFVNHKDLNPWNNIVSNLEWCTQSENCQHAFNNDAMNHNISGDETKNFLFVTIATGRSWEGQSGEGNNNSRMTNEQVHTICKALEEGKPTREITDMLGIEYNRNNIALISSIRQGKRWASISSQYNISKLFERKTKVISPYLKEICEMVLDGKTDDEIIESIPHDGYDEFRFKYFLANIRSGKRHRSLMDELSKTNN